MSRREAIWARIDGSLEAIASLRPQADAIEALTRAVAGRLEAGGTLYTAGNGGSAAHALHLAEELIGRYRDDRPPLRAVCLGADPTAITCIANDFGFDQVFARQCEALVGEGDVLLVLTTSGTSRNLVEALKAARRRGALTVGLLGNAGAECETLCDHAVTVPAADPAHIQETHQVAIHIICEAFEHPS